MNEESVFIEEFAPLVVWLRYRGAKKNKIAGSAIEVVERRTAARIFFQNQPPGSLRSQPSLAKEGSFRLVKQ